MSALVSHVLSRAYSAAAAAGEPVPLDPRSLASYLAVETLSIYPVPAGCADPEAVGDALWSAADRGFRGMPAPPAAGADGFAIDLAYAAGRRAALAV